MFNPTVNVNEQKENAFCLYLCFLINAVVCKCYYRGLHKEQFLAKKPKRIH